ncbi:MAG: RnfABCDGE type electron transport complex subunit D [Oscillospiraceae bacterium]|nr:RnfABCDGE type electron transport complex subunit D [Oscillospiraceae bacterium]
MKSAVPVDYRKQSRSIFIALLPVLFMSIYYYGLRALLLCGFGAAVSVATDLLCRLLQRKSTREPYDLSAVNTGMMLAMMLPASAPYWLVGAGAFLAIAIVRHPFGGTSATLFHPANTAFAFLLICWTELVTRYPLPRQQLPLSSDTGVTLYSSPAAKLMTGGAERLDWLDILMGNFVGPMGCTCVLILVCCGVFFALRGTILWQIPAASLSVVALFAWLLPRVNSSSFSSVTLELISGTMLFSIFFIASVDSGEIHTGLGKWICGFILGGLIVLLRSLSRTEMVTPFAIIIMNTIDHRCDAYGQNIIALLRRIFSLLGRACRWTGRAVVHFFSTLWERFSDLLQKLVDSPRK